MSNDKAAFREFCLKQMKRLARHNKLHHDHRLNRNLESVLDTLRPRSVLFYWPMGFEGDVRRSLLRTRKRASVYLPFMDGESFKMVPFRLPLTRKAFGIYESGNTNKVIKKIDVAIVPAVGIDAEVRRIGFGKGMYDRFFPTLKNRPYIIFIQPKLCFTKERICDHYDISADLVVTPHSCYATTRIGHVKRNTVRRGHCRPQRSNRLSHL